MGQQIGKCYHFHEGSFEVDPADESSTHAFVAQRQRQLEERLQRLPSTMDVEVGRRVKRVSKLLQWKSPTESLIEQTVHDFFVGVEGPAGATNVSSSSVINQLSKDVIHLLQTSKGSYTQASFSILTFLHHNLARVDLIVGSMASEVETDGDKFSGDAFYIADIFMVDVSKLNMAEIVFHCGVALCKHDCPTVRIVVPELLAMISTLQRASPPNISSAATITRDLIRLRKMLRAALQRSLDVSHI